MDCYPVSPLFPYFIFTYLLVSPLNIHIFSKGQANNPEKSGKPAHAQECHHKCTHSSWATSDPTLQERCIEFPNLDFPCFCEIQKKNTKKQQRLPDQNKSGLIQHQRSFHLSISWLDRIPTAQNNVHVLPKTHQQSLWYWCFANLCNTHHLTVSMTVRDEEKYE